MGESASKACKQGQSQCVEHVFEPKRMSLPGNTVIIFDWDDTLLCSSDLSTGACSQYLLGELEKAAISILEVALKLGQVVIVTNASYAWFVRSARDFLPGILPILDRVRVVSARDKYNQEFPQDPFAWKSHAFDDVLDSLPHSNLVALGDSLAEIEAARTSRGSSFVKTLQFKRMPSTADLIGELRRVVKELINIVQKEDSACMHLVRPAGLTRSNTATLGWRLTSLEPWGYPGHTLPGADRYFTV